MQRGYIKECKNAVFLTIIFSSTFEEHLNRLRLAVIIVRLSVFCLDPALDVKCVSLCLKVIASFPCYQ